MGAQAALQARSQFDHGSALTALYRPDQLRGHLHRAFDNGVTKEEIIEVITHLSFYAGWPNGGTAALIAKEVFKERGV